jgi:crotonobetaine/carnitine-CoA ligase
VSKKGLLMPITREDLLPQTIQRQAEADPERIYLQEVGGGSQTYAQTHAAAQHWAIALRGLGIRAADNVLVFMPPCMETVNVWVGLGWLRAIDVPVNTEYRGSILSFVMERSKAEILIVHRQYLDAFFDVADGLTRVKTVVTVGGLPDSLSPAPGRIQFIDAADLLAGAPGERDGLDGPEPYDVATMMYTSGTTGISKGVLSPWGNFANGGRRFGPPGDVLTSDDALYAPLPLYHVGGTYWINAIAQLGARMVLRSRFSTNDFWPDVRQYGCTIAFLLGGMSSFLDRQPLQPDDADNPMKYALLVPMLQDTEGFERRFGLEVYSVYGMTEIGVTMKTPMTRVNNTSCGHPFPEFDVRIVDDHDNEIPPGGVGELLIRPRDPWIFFNGYFEMPEVTAAAWQNLWFHTGDALRVDPDGNYYFVDRIKDAIRRRGENISSVEVETYINRHPGVLECAAVPVASEWSEDEIRICVVPKPGASFTEVELIDFLIEEKMPKFMIPRFVAYLDALPRTATGKVKKHEMRRPADRSDWDRDTVRPLRGR